MDTDEGQYITKKSVAHVLELQETVSLPQGLPCTTPTPPYYLSLVRLETPLNNQR